jgi:hypothetical protein
MREKIRIIIEINRMKWFLIIGVDLTIISSSSHLTLTTFLRLSLEISAWNDSRASNNPYGREVVFLVADGCVGSPSSDNIPIGNNTNTTAIRQKRLVFFLVGNNKNAVKLCYYRTLQKRWRGNCRKW